MILRAAWVAPGGAAPIRDGYVRVAAGRVAEVGSFGAGLDAADGIQDLGQAVLLPGLVNPHTHLELTAYTGCLPPAPLWDWLLALVQLRREPGRVERERQGVHDGAWQSLRAGVTCVGDISRENVAWQVLKDIPIRKVCYAELLTLADLPPRDPAELRAAVTEIREDELLTAGVTPHTPYTVPGVQIRAAIELAGELQRPWCTHWAETPEEVAFLAGEVGALPLFMQKLLDHCRVQSPKMTPGEYLEQCARGLPPGSLAHVNYIADDDLPRLAGAGHTVAYCPRSHHFFGHRSHPFRRLQAAGIPVTIGTDSAASNENLSVLEELRFVRRHIAEPPTAAELLEMATSTAAAALGLAEVIGTLEVGKAADLAAFPCPADVADPLAALIDAAPAPLGVWVAGRQVV